MISNFFSVSDTFVLYSVFVTKLLIFGILFSTAINVELLILGILFSISVILSFKSVFLARSLVLGIFFSASLIFFSKSDLLVSYLVFKTHPVVSMLSIFVTNLLC